MSDVLTQERFLMEIRDGRRDFSGAVIRGDVVLENADFDPPLDLSGMTFEGNLTIRFVRGCRPNNIRVRGHLVIQGVEP
jgi:hypothetical protein